MIVVVLGGARSGKSELAERRITALAGPDAVTYVATARPDSGVAGGPSGGSSAAGAAGNGGSGGGGSMAGAAVAGGPGAEGLVVGGADSGGPVDSGSVVGAADSGESGDPAWEERIARHRERRPAHWTTVDAGSDLPALLVATAGPVLLDSLGPWVAVQMDGAPDGAALAAALVDRRGHTVVVSDEVGLSVHPTTAAGRRFVDALGAVNRAVIAVADEAWLVVAGRVVALEAEPAWPVDRPR
jgi:adenosylcobinamide kinase/adenosylcobinamide-phosphate guanylyltransferase